MLSVVCPCGVQAKSRGFSPDGCAQLALQLAYKRFVFTVSLGPAEGVALTTWHHMTGWRDTCQPQKSPWTCDGSPVVDTPTLVR